MSRGGFRLRGRGRDPARWAMTPEMTCAGCGAAIPPRLAHNYRVGPLARYCSRECCGASMHPRVEREDYLIGLGLGRALCRLGKIKHEMPATKPHVLWRSAGSSRERARRAAYNARNRGALVVEKFDPYDIFERDNWTCYLCGGSLNRHAHVHAMDAQSLDHVVPLSMGGAHQPANVKACHFGCNSLRGIRTQGLEGRNLCA